MALTDAALVAQVITLGSERAFALLVQRHQEVLRRFLLRLTGGDTMRADDLAQETLIRAWQGLRSFRQLAGFRTWLLAIAYRVFLDDQRQLRPTLSLDTSPSIQSRSAQRVTAGSPSPSSSPNPSPPSSQNHLLPPSSLPSLSPPPSPPSPSPIGECAERFSREDIPPAAIRHDIDLALATLSPPECTCVILQLIEGHTISDIATITRLPQNTVKSHLLRGKKALATYLRRNGY